MNTNEKDVTSHPEEERNQEEELELEAEVSPEEALADEIQGLEEQMSELNDQLLRLHAEYDNYRKRTTQEKASIYPEATAQTVAQFLPVLDNFERAMEYEPDTKEFKEGVEMIYQNFLGVLDSLGVEAIGERGEPFDPELHDAVMRCEDEELGEDCIAMVLQKGYKIGDRVIRHAVVQTAN